MRTKAIPSDIEKFFEGTSMFFPVSDTPVSPAPSHRKSIGDTQALHTERSNGRAVHPNGRTDERTNGAVKRVNGRTTHRLNGVTELTPDEAIDSPQHLPTQPSERTVLQSISSPTPVIEAAPSIPPASATVTPRTTENVQPMPGASILDRLKQGKSEPQELTERYSFEIYRRQKEQIEDFLYAYKKKTGERLSASRLIREAITLYFHMITSGETQ